MKKKVLCGIAVLAIAAIAAFNVNLGLNQESEISVLALANAEALANDEAGEPVLVPCCIGNPEDVCEYSFVDATGTSRTVIGKGMYYCR